MPAEFLRPIQDIFSPVAARDKLAAKADAKHCLVRIAKAPDQPGKRGKIGKLVVSKGILIAAERDQRVVTGVIGRQRFTGMGLHQINLCTGLRQGLSNQSQSGILIILYNENAHSTCLMIALTMILR